MATAPVGTVISGTVEHASQLYTDLQNEMRVAGMTEAEMIQELPAAALDLMRESIEAHRVRGIMDRALGIVDPNHRAY